MIQRNASGVGTEGWRRRGSARTGAAAMPICRLPRSTGYARGCGQGRMAQRRVIWITSRFPSHSRDRNRLEARRLTGAAPRVRGVGGPAAALPA
jgi:hypothetical protein